MALGQLIIQGEQWCAYNQILLISLVTKEIKLKQSTKVYFWRICVKTGCFLLNLFTFLEKYSTVQKFETRPIWHKCVCFKINNNTQSAYKRMFEILNIY